MRGRFHGGLLVLSLAVLLAVPAARVLTSIARAAEAGSAHLSSTTVKQELTAVIDAQLAAFRADDYPRAYTFAAGAVRAMFELAGFEAMVKGGYPLIAHSARAEYGLAFDTGEEAVVNVTIENADGQRAQYQYTLKKEDGAWKITGVGEIKSEGLSV